MIHGLFILAPLFNAGPTFTAASTCAGSSRYPARRGRRHSSSAALSSLLASTQPSASTTGPHRALPCTQTPHTTPATHIHLHSRAHCPNTARRFILTDRNIFGAYARIYPDLTSGLGVWRHPDTWRDKEGEGASRLSQKKREEIRGYLIDPGTRNPAKLNAEKIMGLQLMYAGRGPELMAISEHLRVRMMMRNY